jgi:DNA invertase Pin-like site-specific DNA recombinase
MKVVAYLRVSTDRQAEEGLGLEVQEQAIRKWARQNNHRIAVWTRDEGVSGSNGLETRDGLLDALAALKERRGGGLVVYRLDRLARDLIVQETLLGELRRIGAQCYSTSASEAAYLTDDPDDPSRALIRQVLGAVAQYERAMIALRLRSGRRRKAERGGFAYGSPPLGYQAIDGELVADVDEQKTVARITELHKAGSSLREIAATLTLEGHRPKRSDRWHAESVGRVVRRLDRATTGVRVPPTSEGDRECR